MCTIKAFPTESIHCVTYGMKLYDQLFGEETSENSLEQYYLLIFLSSRISEIQNEIKNNLKNQD